MRLPEHGLELLSGFGQLVLILRRLQQRHHPLKVHHSQMCVELLFLKAPEEENNLKKVKSTHCSPLLVN